MLALVYLILGIIPPLAAGPLAGVIFINILKRGKPWLQIPFWASLILINTLIMFWVITSAGRWLPISSVSAFVFTPIAAVATIPLMLRVKRWAIDSGGVESLPKGWLRTGMLGIPGLQLLSFAALILARPDCAKSDCWCARVRKGESTQPAGSL